MNWDTELDLGQEAWDSVAISGSTMLACSCTDGEGGLVH